MYKMSVKEKWLKAAKGYTIFAKELTGKVKAEAQEAARQATENAKEKDPPPLTEMDEDAVKLCEQGSK
jgi:hypothetical protein